MPLLVVTFHYYREETYESGIYPVSRARLRAQAAELARSYRFITKAELLELVEARYPDDDEPLCLITFDDGLKEQLDAVNELTRLGIPAICFVPTDPIKHGKVLDVHKLHYVRSQIDDNRLHELLDRRYGTSSANLDPTIMESHYPYDSPRAREVKYFTNYCLSAIDRRAFIDEVFAELVAEERAFANDLYMNETDLRELAACDALGAHGARHEPLASLSSDQARQDILESLQFLNTVSGRQIESFSYPYGTESAVGAHLGGFLTEGGVKVAFTMAPGTNRTSEFAQPLFLRRQDTNDAPGGKSAIIHPGRSCPIPSLET